MHTFTVYRTEACIFCQKTASFLDALQEERSDVAVKFIDANKERAAFARVAKTVGRSSVPQIFLDGKYVGGWDELARAASRGQLDAYFAGEPWDAPKRGWLARRLQKS